MSAWGAGDVAAIAGAVGFGTIVSALIGGLFTRRRVSAEATEIITNAAAGVVTNMQTQLEAQARTNEADRARHEERIKQMERDHLTALAALSKSHAEEMDEARRVLQLHVAWDAIAIAKMAEIGVELPPAPPLLPARRFDHPDGGTLGS